MQRVQLCSTGYIRRGPTCGSSERWRSPSLRYVHAARKPSIAPPSCERGTGRKKHTGSLQVGGLQVQSLQVESQRVLETLQVESQRVLETLQVESQRVLETLQVEIQRVLETLQVESVQVYNRSVLLLRILLNGSVFLILATPPHHTGHTPTTDPTTPPEQTQPRPHAQSGSVQNITSSPQCVLYL